MVASKVATVVREHGVEMLANLVATAASGRGAVIFPRLLLSADSDPEAVIVHPVANAGSDPEMRNHPPRFSSSLRHRSSSGSVSGSGRLHNR